MDFFSTQNHLGVAHDVTSDAVAAAKLPPRPLNSTPRVVLPNTRKTSTDHAGPAKHSEEAAAFSYDHRTVYRTFSHPLLSKALSVFK